MNITEILGSNNKGKNILILSGVHGDELTPVYTTYLLSKLDYNNYNFKKITIISAINTEAIKNNTRETPIIKTSDLNRVFSNEEDVKYKDVLTKHIKEHDIIIDIHSSPKCDTFVLLNQDETTNSYVEFCNQNNINYLIRYSAANTIKKYCQELNKIAFTVELNLMSYIDHDSANSGKDLILKIVSKCESLRIVKTEPIHEEYHELYTYKTGMFTETKKCGDIIKQNQEIGRVICLKTFEETSLKLNKKGSFRIICFNSHSFVDGSNCIAYLQPL